MVSQLWQGHQVLHEVAVYAVEPKALALPVDVFPRVQVAKKNHTLEVTLSSTQLVKDLCLDFNVPGNWSNNFFDLLPGRPVTVVFTPNRKLPSEDELHLLHLNALLGVE